MSSGDAPRRWAGSQRGTARCRDSWAGIIIAAAAASSAEAAPQPFELEVYLTGLHRPLGFVQHPADAGVQFVLEQGGRIRVVHGGVLQPFDFLDLTAIIGDPVGDGGLLGLAFAPDYPSDPRFYVSYSRAGPDSTGNAMVLARFRRTGDSLVGDLQSSEELIAISASAAIHFGGHLDFGPDGFLYCSIGDIAEAASAQAGDSLLGKLLRIDVSPQVGYAVPPDNPFVDSDPVAALPEIWAFGLRNPWTFSFDDGPGGSNMLVVTDVGAVLREEVNVVAVGQSGLNFGWPRMEGSLVQDDSAGAGYEPLTHPALEYARKPSSGAAVIGGYVYRGAEMPCNVGRYFFADFRQRWIETVDLLDVVSFGSVARLDLDFSPSAFGRDANGELYVLDIVGGRLLRIVGQGRAGDFDQDCDVDPSDFLQFTTCFAGPGLPIPGQCPDPPAADIDADGDVDLADFAQFAQSYTGRE